MKNSQNMNLDNVMMNFNATSLYFSAMYDEKSVNPKIRTGFVFKPHMNDVFVEAFRNLTFKQEGNERAVFKIKYYNPPNLIFQYLPVKEEVKNIEVITMRNRYVIDTLTIVDFQENVKLGGKVIEFYGGVIYRDLMQNLHELFSE